MLKNVIIRKKFNRKIFDTIKKYLILINYIQDSCSTVFVSYVYFSSVYLTSEDSSFLLSSVLFPQLSF